MLDSLLFAEKEGLIDHRGICEEVDTFILAGYDTISMNLIYALRCLAMYPDVQAKCYEELQECIPEDLSGLNMKQLNNLKYLDCFIRETLRLYPSVPTVKRECIADTVVGGNLFLPKRTHINLHIYDIHRNPKYFQDPEVFRPERFMSSEKRHPYAFIPFSVGQRNCIGKSIFRGLKLFAINIYFLGQKFAILEIKTLLIHILQNFQLQSVSDCEELKFSTGLLLRTNTNVKIKLNKGN